MYLSAERMALANERFKSTFEQTCVAWQAIPHWDTGDPGQTRVRADVSSAQPDPPPAPPLPPAEPVPGPLGGDPVDIERFNVAFYITLAQALAPSPDALLAAVIPRTQYLASLVDTNVVYALSLNARPTPQTVGANQGVGTLLSRLIDARAQAEDAGYRAPSCLLTSTLGSSG